MKVRLLEDNVKLYLSSEESSPSVGTLRKDTEIQLGKVVKANNQEWVEVVDGTFVKGYIKGTVKVFKLHRFAVDQQAVVAFDLPAETGFLKKQYPAGTILERIDEVASGDKKWFKVRDDKGDVGYIDASTKLKVLDGTAVGAPPPLPAVGFPAKPPLNRKEQAKRDMLIGGAMFVVGLLVTIGTYSAASSSVSGGTYLLCWGPVIFGAIQFFKGLANYSKKD